MLYADYLKLVDNVWCYIRAGTIFLPPGDDVLLDRAGIMESAVQSTR